MKILHLSDTHSQHHKLKKLPDADIIIHSGDVSFAGSESEIVDFIEWFCHLPYRYKIFIAGNHDNFLYAANIDGLPENCFYLCNSKIEIEDKTFYGNPLFMEDIISGEYEDNINKIPSGIDVLITHQPPHTILDLSGNINYGSRELLEKVLEIKPKYHLFGHIHDAYGLQKQSEITFINSAVLDANYNLTNKPSLFDY